MCVSPISMHVGVHLSSWMLLTYFPWQTKELSLHSVSINPTILTHFIFFSIVHISLDLHVPHDTYQHQQIAQKSLFSTSHYHPQSKTSSHLSVQTANSFRAQTLCAFTSPPGLALSHLICQPRPLKNQYLSITQYLHSNLNTSVTEPRVPSVKMVKWDNDKNAYILGAALGALNASITNEIAESVIASWRKFCHLPSCSISSSLKSQYCL